MLAGYAEARVQQLVLACCYAKARVCWLTTCGRDDEVDLMIDNATDQCHFPGFRYSTYQQTGKQHELLLQLYIFKSTSCGRPVEGDQVNWVEQWPKRRIFSNSTTLGAHDFDFSPQHITLSCSSIKHQAPADCTPQARRKHSQHEFCASHVSGNCTQRDETLTRTCHARQKCRVQRPRYFKLQQ